MPLYILVFDDNSSFSGGDLKNTKWMEIPNKPIRSIFYSLPTGDMLCLSDFKRIYHYIEVTKDLSGERKGIVNFEFSHIFIEREKQILHYIIDLRKENVKWLSEDNTVIVKLNPIGWRNGEKI